MDPLVKSNQDQIRKNLLTSFGFQNDKEEVDEGNKLEKGILSYQLTSSQTFSIQKSGKLIKEKLEGIKGIANQKLLETFSKVQTLRSQISEEPTQETSDYDSIMNLRIQPIPKTYSWEQISPNNQVGSDSDVNYSLKGDTSKVDTTIADLMRQYNDSVYSYSSYKKDIAMIDTMLNNFQDNKNYDLSVEQATIFGF